MIKECEVLVKINFRNSSYYKNLGYSIDKEIFVKVGDLTIGTKSKVTAICEICSSENKISYCKYNVNINRNGKGYYSCFGCKNFEKEKTCEEKYGVKSYSMTDEFRKSESEKWKGIQKGSEKGRATMLERYGVESYFKTDFMRDKNRLWMSSDEFKIKSKKSLIEKYGVDSYSKTPEFKKAIESKKEIIISKIKETFMLKYGVDWVSKLEFVKNKKNAFIMNENRKNTCLDRYGFDNVCKVDYIKEKRKKALIDRGLIIPDEMLGEWESYKRKVRNITRSNKKELYEKWDGYDYYDGEFIKGYFSYNHIHRFYPTIDHKISVYFGFIGEICPTEIGGMQNLCITKRYINSTKGQLIENQFSFYPKNM